MISRSLCSASWPWRPPAQRAEYVTYANRLFDPRRRVGDTVGAAYGGPDLSHRNLAVLDAARKQARAEGWLDAMPGAIRAPAMCRPRAYRRGVWATRRDERAVPYALSTAHRPTTGHRTPDRPGSKSAKALHLLYFHPVEGLVPWLIHLRHHAGLRATDGLTRWRDLATVGASAE